MTMSYSDALDSIHSLLNYETQQPPGYTPEVISLDRPRALLAALGNPQERYPIIHVAGTKGKGSVSAMCHSILVAAGYKVGFYLSPHLQDFRERFRIGGDMIPPDTFAAIVSDLWPHIQAIPGLTYWEALTAIGFEYFAREQVDIAVIEVGLGGRLDATNVITKPLVSVITSLSFDHTHLLGNTLALIAGEKAGIIKDGVPVVSAPQKSDALEVIEQAALDHHARLTLVGRDFHAEMPELSLGGQTIRVWRNADAPGLPVEELEDQTAWETDADYRDYHIPLLGAHQTINAAVALAAIHEVRVAGIKLNQAAITEGLATVNWPGRFEIVSSDPYIILDAAHNADSADWVADTLRAVFTEHKVTLIFGAFNDKDVAGMYDALLPLTDSLIVMPAKGQRAFPVDVLESLARDDGFLGRIHQAADAAEALALARELTHGVILATGSLTIVGMMRDLLGLSVMHAAYLDDDQTLSTETAEG